MINKSLVISCMITDRIGLHSVLLPLLIVLILLFVSRRLYVCRLCDNNGRLILPTQYKTQIRLNHGFPFCRLHRNFFSKEGIVLKTLSTIASRFFVISGPFWLGLKMLNGNVAKTCRVELFINMNLLAFNLFSWRI